MNRIRYFLKLVTAYTVRFKGIIFLGILIGFLIFLLARFVYPFLFQGKTVRIAVTGRYHVDELPEYILKMIGDGLTKVNDSGIPEPDLSYSWETIDKGKTWTFKLADTNWQDDEKVTSNNIVYEFSDVEVEKPDNKTITFKLKNPYSPFPVVVSKPTFRKGLLGTGEWSVDNLKLNAGYVEQLILVNGKKNKEIYKFYPTTERTKLAYKLGEVDKIEKILDPQPFTTWSNSQITQSANENQVVVLFFNTQDKYMGEKTYRQALNYAIDKEKLGERAISPISPISWVFNPQVKTYQFDKDRARELFDSLPDELKDNMEIKLVTTSVLLNTAEKISDDWKELGISTSIQVSPVVPTEYQAYLTILDIPKDPDQYPLWHSTQQTTNISKYVSPRIDKLLEDGRTEMNNEERRRIYLDFQRFLLEDSPAAFLYHPTYYTVIRK